MNTEKTSKAKDAKLFTCDVCSKQFTQLGHAKSHRRTHFADIPENKPFHCINCPATFSTKKILNYHQIIHTNEPIWSCDICDAVSCSPGQALNHKKVHQPNYEQHWLESHPDITDPSQCKKCGALFVKKCNAARHKSIHEPERPHVCNLCGATFKMRKRLLHHFSFDHWGVKPFSCTKCDCKFVRKREISSHMYVHSAATSGNPQDRAD